MFEALLTWDRHSCLNVLCQEDGQDMVEYALLLAAISVSTLAIIVLVGPYISNLFGFIINQLGTA